MIDMGSNRYGKSAIRLVRIQRDTTPHRIWDLTVSIALDGEFAASYRDGDNSDVIATDTMKNTAYALAKEHLTTSIEDYAIAVGRHFASQPKVQGADVFVEQHRWQPIGTSRDAFVREGSFTRTALARIGGDSLDVQAGIDGMSVMKTTRSAFAGFPRDRYTTLKETDDRVMATKVSARWEYERGAPIDFNATYDAVLATFLDTFADHDSASVQASIWIVGKAILERHAAVESISMSLPNLHHWTVDLSPFGLENDREIYVATTEPHGLIEATVRRSDLAAKRL